MVESDIFALIHWLVMDNDRACEHDDVNASYFTCGEIHGLAKALETMGYCVDIADDNEENGCIYPACLRVDGAILIDNRSMVGLVNAI